MAAVLFLGQVLPCAESDGGNNCVGDATGAADRTSSCEAEEMIAPSNENVRLRRRQPGTLASGKAAKADVQKWRDEESHSVRMVG